MSESSQESIGQGISDVIPSIAEIAQGGEKYILTAMKVKHLALLETWARRQVVRDAVQVAAELPENMREKVISDAVKRSAVMRLSDKDCMALLQSGPGIVEIFYLSLKEHHPDMTREKAGEMVLANRDEIERKIDEINGLMTAVEGGEGKAAKSEG